MKFEEALQIPPRNTSARIVIGSCIDIWFNSPDDEDGYDDNWLDNPEDAQRVGLLIRAAPEMLAELESIYNFFNQPVDQQTDLFDLLHNVRRVISKAKGL